MIGDHAGLRGVPAAAARRHLILIECVWRIVDAGCFLDRCPSEIIWIKKTSIDRGHH